MGSFCLSVTSRFIGLQPHTPQLMGKEVGIKTPGSALPALNNATWEVSMGPALYFTPDRVTDPVVSCPLLRPPPIPISLFYFSVFIVYSKYPLLVSFQYPMNCEAVNLHKLT